MKKKIKLPILYVLVFSSLFCCNTSNKKISNNLNERPNFLILMTDDVSPEQQSPLYGANFAVTPGFDSIAKNGLLFNQAYASTSSCAPARASLLTLRNIWQNEEAACHLSVFPNTFPTYVELLKEKGYHCGIYRNMWKPGENLRHYTAGKLINKGNKNMDIVDALDLFLKENTEDKPFHFVMNTFDGHAPFDNSKWKLYRNRMDTMNVPGFMPTNKETKKRFLNANYEIERFDKKIVKALNYLKEKKLFENTVIIVTSDNGSTLGGNAKGLGAYETGCRIPLAIQWLKGINNAGRKIDDLVTQIDVSKTILDLANIKPANSMTEGKSLKNIFYSNSAGIVDKNRTEVYFGFERHIINRPQNRSCYPIRSIRTQDYLYVWNLEPDRHIWGDKNVHWFNNNDGKPQTQYTNHNGKKTMRYYNAFTKKRSEEELFDMKKDKACLHNLAHMKAYDLIKQSLRKKLENKLINDNDPRMFDNGSWLDLAPFPPSQMKHARTKGCKAFDENYVSPFSKLDYPANYKQRPWSYN